MVNRKREKRIYFHVSDEEFELIKRKMELTGIRNREAYLRKMAIDGYVLSLDLSGVQELIFLLRNATNNLNQIAKRANETRNIYKEDITNLQDNYEKLWDIVSDILKELAKF